MKTRVYFFRLIIGLMAFALGLGVYFSIQYFNAEEEVQPTCMTETEYLQRFTEISNHLDEIKENEAAKSDVPAVPADVPAINEFYPDGEFYIPEDLPKEFKDFESFTVEANDWGNTSEANDYSPEAIIPKGFITAKSKYTFIKINLNNRKILFETEKIKGVSYKFIGDYPSEEIIGHGDSYVAIKGTLTKLKDGKKIASVKVELVQVDGC